MGHETKLAKRYIAGVLVSAAAFVAAALCGLMLVVASAPSAQALPIFARQTGQPCGSCHTDVLGLTPFGRRFKLGGYTLGGGPFRKTLFPIPPSGKVFPAVDDFKSVLLPGASASANDSVAQLRSYAEQVETRATTPGAAPRRRPEEPWPEPPTMPAQCVPWPEPRSVLTWFFTCATGRMPGPMRSAARVRLPS